jgi:hypothetical protein
MFPYYETFHPKKNRELVSSLVILDYLKFMALHSVEEKTIYDFLSSHTFSFKKKRAWCKCNDGLLKKSRV